LGLTLAFALPSCAVLVELVGVAEKGDGRRHKRGVSVLEDELEALEFVREVSALLDDGECVT